ncbi:S66 peptidase family protein [Bacillus sp. AFS053548]|uniref:S66 family peptidase n=1 Tax=Bacillus sp. AFS053548 TaxID=2033505 RepID=UPI000BFDC249|nr:S66 peptidase family protein [Bacillus sp. AFS053548]PGM56636.1 LD-carboxypeptidase [Bacillus sp. AFS053548]
MIKYPVLKSGATIGVTAPSSGLKEQFHELMKQSINRMERDGFKVECGDIVWTQDKAKSANANKRAYELNRMMKDEKIDLIFPPWGGELAIEILNKLAFESYKEKWILGYSDTSIILLALTLTTGIATAHGTNLIDLRGEYSDDTTAMWQKVLATKSGSSITQTSSELFQAKWQHENPSPYVFHLSEKTNWKTTSNENEKIKGRLLGGCIDVIRHLVGTPYGDVRSFRSKYIEEEPIIWYFENCEMNTTDLRRSLVQMQLAGWFESCAGILFGRSAANQTVDNYTIEDVYNELNKELAIPIIYDIDCGHVPPQITLINGAFAEVDVKGGKGKIVQSFI